MPAEWMGLVVLLAAEPREAPARDAGLPLEFLEYLADVDRAPAWLRDAPMTPELDDPPSPPPPPTTGRKKEAR